MNFKTLAASVLLAGTAMPASALTIDFNNVNNISTTSDAYRGFRAAADFWQSIISTDVTLYMNIGFANLGSPNVIGQTASTRFAGFDMGETYAQLAQAGNSRLDKIAAANMSPLVAATSWYTVPGVGQVPTVAVNAITQKAKANGTGVVQNTRMANTNFTGTAANAIGLNGIETASNREWDNDRSRNNQDMLINSSIMKAIGYGISNSDYSDANRDASGRGIDAKITFNSTFAFDFNPTNGIGEGKIDFIGTAIHEFGHALGFVSGVDIYDTNSNLAFNLDDLQGLMSTLDLFRYSDDVNNLAPGTGQVLDWSVGNSATATDNLFGRPYFSFDGKTKGLTSYGGDAGYFSTGSTFGDGRQASHFMDTPYAKVPGSTAGVSCNRAVVPSRGILDPTFSGCELGTVTALDLAAFDAMGWNLRLDALSAAKSGKVFTSARAYAGIGGVPEPTSWALMISGFGMIGGALRRRRDVGIATA